MDNSGRDLLDGLHRRVQKRNVVYSEYPLGGAQLVATLLLRGVTVAGVARGASLMQSLYIAGQSEELGCMALRGDGRVSPLSAPSVRG